MSGSEKAKAKKEQMMGKMKEAVGRVAGSHETVAEGRGEKLKGYARQAREKAKDAFHR
ncbi:CsbD family protein [Streptomyces sp. NPDC055400]